MTTRTQSRGTCLFCGYETTKGAMARHLAKCTDRAERIAQAQASVRKSERLYTLRVQDAYVPSFWLLIEMPGSAKLKHLDDYLRGIWLECCGHLSDFSLERWGDPISKNREIRNVFHEGVTVTHIYDFGTSSETTIAYIGARDAIPLNARQNQPVTLLARNVMPAALCQECNQPATHLCMECVYDQQTSGMLCDQHTKNHPHDDYGEPLALVNSPRLGMCGYEGPAEPPY